MNQSARDALSGILQSEEGKRRVLEWVSTLIREGSQETRGDTSMTTNSHSETVARSGLMSHSDRNGSAASLGGPEETGLTASLGGPEDTGSAVSLGGPDDVQEPRDEMSGDNSHSSTEVCSFQI